MQTHSHGRIACFALAFMLMTISFLANTETIAAQQTIFEQIKAHLDSGEFPAAIKLADALPQDKSDLAHREIAQAQSQAGAHDAAFQSAANIVDDRQRAQVLTHLANFNSPAESSGLGGPGFGSGSSSGGSDTGVSSQQGGVTEADFEPLIELIKSTISPDGWDDTSGDGTIQAYPSGVYVDGKGLLKRMKVDTSDRSRLRIEALTDSGNRLHSLESDLRKISLTRLEKAASIAAAQGHPLDDEMLYLAGIYQIKYLMVYPETGDIVIAGPAGPYGEDTEGRLVNSKTGKPILHLDDLVVCLRNAYENNGKFGCAITPRQTNLAETKKVLATSRKRGRAWREQLQQTLGRQDVSVFGIDPQTHAGRVLVEADYRMKLVGMGLEDSIPEVPSYLSRIELAADGSLPPMDVVRWWFTLNYDDVMADADKTTFSFTGPGVKVLSENEMINDLGERIHTGMSKGPTREFARDFTNHFAKMAKEYPIYNQLKNVFDLAMVSSLIRQQGLAKQVDWHLTYFGNDARLMTYQLEIEPTPTEVDSVINHRVIKERKKSSTVKHTVVGISGGIRFDVNEAIGEGAIKVDEALTKNSAEAKPGSTDNWWWD